MIDNPKTDPLCAVQPSAELDEMKAADDVMVMLGLHRRGWSARRIATELKVSRNTVKRYIAEGEPVPYAGGGRRRALDGLDDWLAERFDRHRGNAEVIREELAVERTHSP